MLRVLHCFHQFGAKLIGGVEQSARTLLEELEKRNCRNRVFSAKSDRSLPQYSITTERWGEIECTYVNNVVARASSFELLYRDLSIEAAFDKLLCEFDPHIVHFHHLSRLSTGLPGVAAKRSIPSVMKLADFKLQCHYANRVQPNTNELCEEIDHGKCADCLETVMNRFMSNENKLLTPQDRQKIVKFREDHIKAQLDFVDVFLSPSRFLRDDFVSWGLPKSKVRYLDNGFNIPSSPVLKSPSSTVRFAFLGRLTPIKGVHLIPEALTQLPGLQLRCTLYGPHEGPISYREGLVSACNADSRLHLHGPVAPSEISRLFSEIDILILPSIWYENSPLSIHEAYVAKTPVIAADHGGMREYVADGHTGLLFSPGDAKSLASAMKRVVKDANLRKTMESATGAQLVSSKGLFAQKLTDVYYSLATKS